MTAPDKARYIAELLGSFTDGLTIDKAIVHLNDLANQVERLEAQRKLLREALVVSVGFLVPRCNNGEKAIATANAALKETE